MIEISLTLVFDLLLLQLQRFDVILDIFTALFLPDLHALTSFLEHDDFKLHFSLLVK